MTAGDRARLAHLKKAFADLDTIDASFLPRLEGLLQRGPSDFLRAVVKQRIKHCWPIAVRILQERGITVKV